MSFKEIQERHNKYRKTYDEEENKIKEKIKEKKEQGKKLYLKEKKLEDDSVKFLKSHVGELKNIDLNVNFNRYYLDSGIEINLLDNINIFWSDRSIVTLDYKPLDRLKSLDESYEKFMNFENELKKVFETKDKELLSDFINKYSGILNDSDFEISYSSSGGFKSTEEYEENGEKKERSIMPKVVSTLKEVWNAADKIVQIKDKRPINELYLKSFVVRKQKNQIESEFRNLENNLETGIRNFFALQLNDVYPLKSTVETEKQMEIFEDNESHQYEFNVMDIDRNIFIRKDLLKDNNLEEEKSRINKLTLDTTDVGISIKTYKIISEKTAGGQKRFYLKINNSNEEKSLSKREAFELIEKARDVNQDLLNTHKNLFGRDGYNEQERKNRRERIENGFPHHGNSDTAKLHLEAYEKLNLSQENKKDKKNKRKPKL
tara:strand:- start:13546 stop:14841 length:1296 start_codon:yes stop_codon:yes gene_type:complete